MAKAQFHFKADNVNALTKSALTESMKFLYSSKEILPSLSASIRTIVLSVIFYRRKEKGMSTTEVKVKEKRMKKKEQVTSMWDDVIQVSEKRMHCHIL